jgi:hypothetical protein
LTVATIALQSGEDNCVSYQIFNKLRFKIREIDIDPSPKNKTTTTNKYILLNIGNI